MDNNKSINITEELEKFNYGEIIRTKEFPILKFEEVKEGKNWRCYSMACCDGEIYKELSSRLISKKIDGCTWIKRIEKHYLYWGNGTDKITITYDNDYRTKYYIFK